MSEKRRPVKGEAKAAGAPSSPKKKSSSSKGNEVVSLLCPVCDKPYKVARRMLGKEVECKDCGRTFVLKDPKAEAKKAKKKAKVKPVKADDTYEANCKVCEEDTIHKFNHCSVCGLTEMESGRAIDAGVTKLKSAIAVLIYVVIAFAVYWKNPDDRRGKVRPEEGDRKGIHERSYKGKETFLEKMSGPDKR